MLSDDEIIVGRKYKHKKTGKIVKNVGLHQYRFKDNPREKAYAKAWEELNDFNEKGTLDYLLAKDCNRPAGEVTDRDREVAATVIQWLGSPVGQGFVRDVLDTITHQ